MVTKKPIKYSPSVLWKLFCVHSEMEEEEKNTPCKERPHSNIPRKISTYILRTPSLNNTFKNSKISKWHCLRLSLKPAEFSAVE